MQLTQQRAGSILIASVFPFAIVIALVFGHGLINSINKRNFDRVQNGMALQQVELIFGGPPNITDHPFLCHEIWARPDKAVAFIEFTDGLVTDKRWRESKEEPLTTIGRWIDNLSQVTR
jgi:hypothetical protein